MNKQKIFKFFPEINYDENEFYINKTNQEAFNLLNNDNFHKYIFLKGPKKSGKTHLLKSWSKKNCAIDYKNNLEIILNNKKNIFLDDVFININEEKLFHVINHCKLYNLKILLTSDIDIYDFNFLLNDLKSRLKTFTYTKINNPDDDMILKLLTKLLIEKQFIVKNKDIFDYLITRAKRSYNEIHTLVNKLDRLSLEKKRQITIPLIKEIL